VGGVSGGLGVAGVVGLRASGFGFRELQHQHLHLSPQRAQRTRRKTQGKTANCDGNGYPFWRICGRNRGIAGGHFRAIVNIVGTGFGG
jgi:hypothetical protein